MKTITVIENNNQIIMKYGQNASENHQLVDNSKQYYWWFHLDKFPSGHCIIENEIISNTLINKAASIVKENSKYKNLKNLKVKYLQIKYIQKTNKLGEVLLLKKGKIIKI